MPNSLPMVDGTSGFLEALDMIRLVILTPDLCGLKTLVSVVCSNQMFLFMDVMFFEVLTCLFLVQIGVMSFYAAGCFGLLHSLASE